MSELSEPSARVAQLMQPLPESVRITQGMTMTPNEMRLLREKTGKTLQELLGGDPEDMDAAPDRIQALVWVQLRRLGHECEWEEAGDVLPEMGEAEPDPSETGPSATSPPSATSGE